MTADPGPEPARRRRSIVLLFALLAFAILVYLITLARLGFGGAGA